MSAVRLRLRFCVWLSFFCATAITPAAPIVEGTTGSASHKGILTVSGSGFGTKPTAAPLKWDDFDAGTPGQTVGNGWYVSSNKGTTANPKYSNAVVRSTQIPSNRTAFQDFTNGSYNQTIGIVNQSLRTVYLSGWYYMNIGGNETRNFKMFALRGGPAGDWNSPNVRMDQHPNDSWGNDGALGTQEEANPVCGGTGSADRMIGADWGIGGTLHTGAWHRFEIWFTYNASTLIGDYQAFRNLKVWGNGGLVGKKLFNRDCPFSNLYLSAYYTDDGVGTPKPWAQIYWDEVYIDTTRARVEICRESTWSSRTHCEIQPPRTWSSNSVTVTVNQGALSNGSTAYVYVVDSSGQVNASGYRITVGDGTPNDPPADARGLRRSDLK